MKKLVLSVAFIAAIGFWGVINAQAQTQEKKASTEQVTNQTANTGFVDANADGICDNYDGKRPGKGLGPGNGNGLGRANGKGLGRKVGKGRGRGNINGSGQRLRDGSGPGCNRVTAQ